MVRTEIILVIALLITMAVVPIAGAAGDELQAAPTNPDFIRYMEAKDTNIAINTLNSVAQDDAQPLGLIPSPIFRPGIKDIQMFGLNEGDHTTNDPDVFTQQTSGPVSPVINQTRFDLRTTGNISPVRNQDPWGTCWAFATYGSLESTLMPTDAAPDFSEKNLVNLAGFSQPGTPQEAGGQMWMSTAYLTRWNGPVNESTDPYPIAPINNWTDSSAYPPTKHVQNVVFFPARTNRTDNANLKGALVQWGAVYSSFCWFDDFYNGTYKSYYQPAANLSTHSGHAVTIAGWDDTYEAKNFTVIPDGPGAWIVKNSWGATWGDAGYFYVSYYDKHFGSVQRPDGTSKDTGVFLGEITSNYDKVYSFDKLGEVNDIWYNTKKTGGFANVFTANSSENITAIGFYTTDMNVSSTISIYKNPTSGPVEGTPAATFSKTLPYMGYNTVNIPSNLQVPVTKGNNFSVVIQVTNPTNDFYIPIEENQGNYTANITSDFGQGYLLGSTGWVDLNTTNRNNSHVCVKAYTRSTTTPPGPNMLNGTIYYSGIENAPIYLNLFNQTPAPGVIPYKTKNLTYFGTPIKYGFTAGNGTFWVMAYMDLNRNHTPDFNEPRGFAINKSFLVLPDPIQVTGNMTGLDVTLFEIQPRISLTLAKDFTVSTKNNTILAGTQDSRMRYQMRFFPINQSLIDFVVGNMSFALAAENISDVDYKPYAIWNSSAADWVFPPEFSIKSNNGLTVTADTTTHKDKPLNMSLSREVNRTVFSENGTQLLTANITFTSKEFLTAYCIIDTTHSARAQTRFVPGSVSSNAPIDWIETYDQWILFIFNRTEIRTDVPYTLSVVTSVEPNGTPVTFMPRITAGQTFYSNNSPGDEAHVGVMPKILLPKTVCNASAASNVSGIWQYYTENNMLAILEQVDQPVSPSLLVNGTIYYSGTQNAPVYVYLFNQTPAPGVQPFKTKNLTYSGTPIKYGFTAGNGTFWVMAYMDLNGNHTPDANEPWGFAINRTRQQGPDPVQVTGNVSGLDVTLFEPQLYISLMLTKGYNVNTTNNTILAGTQDSRLGYQMVIFPTTPSESSFVLGNLSFAFAAQNISNVDHKQFAVWNSSTAVWTFPPEFTIQTNNGLTVTADTSIHADKPLNMSLSRKVNQTVFAENGIQLLTVNITFTSTDSLASGCIIDVPYTTRVHSRFIPGSVSTTVPTKWIDVYDQWVMFDFNQTEIRAGVPYTLSIISQVAPNGTPVEFIPRVSASQLFYQNRTLGPLAPVGVMPGDLLPKEVTMASAAVNVSGVWDFTIQHDIGATLDCVVKPASPSPVLNGTIINQSATIFIGEQGLNVTHALNQAQGNPSIDGVPPLKSIGWWASGSPVNTTSPTRVLDLNGRYGSFNVSPEEFVGYTGTWYVIQADGYTATGIAFVVVDPRLDLRILDFTHAADVTGQSVPQNTRLGFGIATNMYPAVDARYRSPINPATDGYITIKVKNAVGSTWQSLYNNSASAGTLAGPNTLLANFVNVQPWAWGGNSTWSWQTNARDTSDQYAYPPGVYTASAESTLNHMKDNYKMAGADYTGKTVSPTYTLNLRVCGDFNGNNNVDIGDTARVAYMVVGLTPVDMAADFNGAGVVDIGDAAKIAWYIVGKVPAL